MARLEMAAGNIVTYKECGEITAQLIDCMRIGMLQNISDPGIVWDVLSDVTSHANNQLAPLGYGISWRIP
jgi:hypothetical protein